MKELTQLRNVIIKRIELENEASALSEKLPADRREQDRLARVARSYQEELESIQRSGLKGLFLRITGRHEQRLEEAQRQAAKASAEMRSAQFLLEANEGRIRAIEKSLEETKSDEMRFQTCLEEHFPEDAALSASKKEVQALQTAMELRKQVNQELETLNQLVDQAISTHTHGDMQTSATGTRYNRRERTLKDQCQQVEGQLSVLCNAISNFNGLVPQGLQDELEGPWTGNNAYLTEPLTDPALLARLIGLQDWTIRIKRGWTKSTPVLITNLRQANNRLRYLLLSLYDQLP